MRNIDIKIDEKDQTLIVLSSYQNKCQIEKHFDTGGNKGLSRLRSKFKKYKILLL